MEAACVVFELLHVADLCNRLQAPVLQRLPKPSPTLASLSSDSMQPSFLRDLDDEA